MINQAHTSLESVREKRNTGAASTAGDPATKPMSSKNANWLPWKLFGPTPSGRGGILGMSLRRWSGLEGLGDISRGRAVMRGRNNNAHTAMYVGHCMLD